MSVVYSAVHVSLRTHHAVKVFDVGNCANAGVLRGKFLAEARVLATLRHPNIVRVTDYGTTDDGRPWLAMDFVEGETLAVRLAGANPPTPEETVGLYRDIRSALAYCHLRGIVHGDLKAENILLRSDGHAVLSDFGIARIVNPEMRTRLELTCSCEAGGFGTAHALAPECRDGALATSASDVYSFGVLMFKVVTGIWYDGSERLLGHLNAFAPKWSVLLGSMLQRDPSRRPASAGELPEDSFGGWCRRAAIGRHLYGTYALVAAASVVFIAFCVFAAAATARWGHRALPSAREDTRPPGLAGGDVVLSAGRTFMREAAHFRRIVLPDDGIVSIKIPDDFTGVLLSAEEVDGELRERVRVVPQSGMRVLYRGNREVVIKRQ